MPQSVALQIASFLIYLAVIAIYIVNIAGFPKHERLERTLYVGVLVTWVLHLLVFYAVVIEHSWGQPNIAASEAYRDWSAVVRLHGGMALLIKEILANWRAKKIRAAYYRQKEAVKQIIRKAAAKE